MAFYPDPLATIAIDDDVLPHELDFVLENIRPEDAFEAACIGSDMETAARALLQYAHDSFVAIYHDEPAFIFGTVQLMPGVRQLYGFGTRRTTRCMPLITEYTNEVWLPQMRADGVRRIQVHIPQSNRNSVKWLQSFGMHLECEMADYAPNGATMAQYAFTSEDFKNVSVQRVPQLQPHHYPTGRTSNEVVG